MIRRDAAPAVVERAAAAVESYVAENATARAQLGQITRRIVDAGKLDQYGTPRAREILRDWAGRFGGGDEKAGANRSKPGRISSLSESRGRDG